MILDHELQIDKNVFLKSKLNNIQYYDLGNFTRHLYKEGYTKESYLIEFYHEYLPVCLETGKRVFHAHTQYWNICCKLDVQYKKWIPTVKILSGTAERIKIEEPQYHTKYITFEYWLYEEKIKLSAAIEKISYFLRTKHVRLYQRLADAYYDELWSCNAIQIYKQKILELNYEPLYNKWSQQGFDQRGGQYHDIYQQYFNNRICSFKDPEIQKRNSAKFLAKYSKEERRKFNVKCIEYWMNKGYTYEESINKISELQTLTSIEGIEKRHNCTKKEAIDIQKEIYNKRAVTISNKPIEELKDMYKRQDSGSMDYCLRKCNFNIEEAAQLHYELKKKRCVPFGRASKESLKYFLPLYKFLRGHDIMREDIYFGIFGSSEYNVYDDKNKKMYIYDFTILSKKLIIEYDGEYWHADPTIYNPNDIIKFPGGRNVVVNDIWKLDNEKAQAAKLAGFKILRISSTLSSNEKFNLLNNFIYENLQIKNPNWEVI